MHLLHVYKVTAVAGWAQVAAVAGWRHTEAVLRKVIGLDGVAVGEVRVVLVAVLRHAHVGDQHLRRRAADLGREVLPRVVLIAVRVLLVKADED